MGRINISLKETAKDQIELIYTDNGIGISKEINWKKADSLGLQLVKLLAEEQLDGTIELKKESGTCFVIEFELLYNR
jgi:two-component sensor histidine kinase